MIDPKYVLAWLLVLSGCESPDEGFAKAETEGTLEAWEAFWEKHGDAEGPKVAQGSEVLTGMLLER